MTNNIIVRALTALSILALAITSYAIWGESSLLLALLAGLGFEAWFWCRLLKKN